MRKAEYSNLRYGKEIHGFPHKKIPWSCVDSRYEDKNVTLTALINCRHDVGRKLIFTNGGGQQNLSEKMG